MAAINTISDLYAALDAGEWFHSLGKPIDSDISCKVVGNLGNACTLWKADFFTEARSVAWEAFRQELVKDSALKERWIREFKICNEKVLSSFGKSSRASDLVKSSGQNLVTFCQSLPFVGAVGELLVAEIKPEYTFNLQQLSYFAKGHWVCGWEGQLFEDEFIYPSGTFVVY